MARDSVPRNVRRTVYEAVDVEEGDPAQLVDSKVASSLRLDVRKSGKESIMDCSPKCAVYGYRSRAFCELRLFWAKGIRLH